MAPDHRLTILLVEDEPGDAALVKARLLPDAEEIVHVTRLSEAVQVLAGRDVDVVLLDLGLPDGQGLEAVERLVAVTDVPLVVLTGRDDDLLADDAVIAGAQDYVVKGSSPIERLDRVLRNAIERKRLWQLLEEGLHRQQALTAITRYGLALTELPARLWRIGRELRHALGCDVVAVFDLLDGGPRLRGGDGLDTGSVDPDVLAHDVAARVLSTGWRLLTDRTTDHTGGTAATVTGIPLPGAAGPSGALVLAGPRPLEPSELEFLEVVAATLSEILSRDSSEAALGERVKELKAFGRIARATEELSDPTSLAPEVAQALAEAMERPADVGVTVDLDDASATVGAADAEPAIDVPIVTERGTRGRLRLGRTDGGTFLPEEKALATTVAESLAVWIGRRDADGEVRHERARLQALFDNTLDAVLLYDSSGRHVDANPAARALLGLPAVGPMGGRVRDYTPPEDRWRLDEVDRAMAREGSWSGDWNVVTRDGRRVLVETRLVADVVPGLHLCTARDVTTERSATAALRRSEERFRSLVQNASDAVLILDRDGCPTYVSPSVERILGYRPEDLLGRSYLDFVPSEQRDIAVGRWTEACRADVYGPLIHRLRHTDGTWRYVEVVHSNRFDDPAVGGMVANLRDVTERIRGQRALQDSEERFRRLVEHAPDVIMRVDVDGERRRLSYVSRAIEAMTGYPPEAFYADPDLPRRLVHPDDTVVLDVGEEVEIATLRIQHRDGSWRWLERRTVPAHDRSGRLVAIEAITRDITDSRLTQEELRASEDRLSRTLETMGEGVFVFDAAGRVTYANPTAAAMVGVTVQDLQGLSPVEPGVEVLGADGQSLPLDQHPVLEVLRSGRVVRDAELGLRRDGQRRIFQVNVSPLKDREDCVSGAVASFRDVTSRREAEHHLQVALERERQASAELRRLDEMKTAFLQSVSHEIRTPLTSVVGFSELLSLRGEGLTPERRTDLLGRLRDNALRLETMLIDLLDLDRVGRGVIELHRRPVDLMALVLRVLADVGADGRVHVTGERMEAEVDAARIERVVENLVTNALRHTPEGSAIDLSLVAEPDRVLLVVADRGPGIVDARKEAIFSPFQVGDSPAARVGGAGIGLTTARAFVTLHGGRLWVEDREGGGARFVVALPRDGCGVPEDQPTLFEPA